jgi:hypothetical protein
MYLTPSKKHWAIDIETDDLNATVIWVACVRNVVTKEEHTLRGQEAIKEFVDAHVDALWVTHNGIEFDIPTINRLLGTNIPVTRVVDTFVLVHAVHAYAEGGHSLAAWAKRVGMKKDRLPRLEPSTVKKWQSTVFRIPVSQLSFLRLSRECEKSALRRWVVPLNTELGLLFDSSVAMGLLLTLNVLDFSLLKYELNKKS